MSARIEWGRALGGDGNGYPRNGAGGWLTASERKIIKVAAKAEQSWAKKLSDSDGLRPSSSLVSPWRSAEFSTTPERSRWTPKLSLWIAPEALRQVWIFLVDTAAGLVRVGDLVRGHRFDLLSKRALAVGGCAAGFAVTAAAFAGYGYVKYDEKHWLARIKERAHSPILGQDGTLVGSMDTHQGKVDTRDSANRAFLPLQGALPNTYRAGYVFLENRNFDKGGVHNVCGLDLPSTVARWVTRFGAGGSTISMQTTKELNDWSSSDPWHEKVVRKFVELGASCSLYKAVTKQDGPEGMIRLAASYSPVVQGNGVLRGIEGGARALFDADPHQLSDALQLVLAAAAKEPIRLLAPGDIDTPCIHVYPAVDNPSYDNSLAKIHGARRNQCRVLHRAKFAAKGVLAGEQLSSALAELEALATDGIQVTNPFEPIDEKRLINLSTRTRAAMPTGVLEQIKRETSKFDYIPGEPLTVSFDAVQQHEFSQRMRAALFRTQTGRVGAGVLCMPLIKLDGEAIGTNRKRRLQRCGVAMGEDDVADVFAMKVDARTGGIKSVYASTPLLLRSPQSLGSVNKLVIVLAALQSGYTPESLVCPKAAFDGARPLNRVSAPQHGFASCAGGRNAITLYDAIARSDNLAIYDLAQSLGEEKVRQAAFTLGLGDPAAERNILFATAFGSYGATLEQTLAAMQGLVSAAWAIRVSGQAPRILTNVEAASPIAAAIGKALPHIEQRASLRTLLSAPIEHKNGTLRFLSGDGVVAGKSGTVQSAVKAPDGHQFGHSKWAVTYQAASNEINVFLVGSPLPSKPFALHSVQASVLLDVHRTLLSASRKY